MDELRCAWCGTIAWAIKTYGDKCDSCKKQASELFKIVYDIENGIYSKENFCEDCFVCEKCFERWGKHG